MIKRAIDRLGRILGRVMFQIDSRSRIAKSASTEAENGPKRVWPPLWRLVIERDYDRTGEHTTWILEAIHNHDRRAIRIKDFRWQNTLNQTHRALKIVEEHTRPAKSGRYLSARQIAELYRHNGAEHGPAMATVEIADPRRRDPLRHARRTAKDRAG